MITTGHPCNRCGRRLQVALAASVKHPDRVLALVRCNTCAQQDGLGDLRGVTIAPDTRWSWFMLPEPRR